MPKRGQGLVMRSPRGASLRRQNRSHRRRSHLALCGRHGCRLGGEHLQLHAPFTGVGRKSASHHQLAAGRPFDGNSQLHHGARSRGEAGVVDLLFTGWLVEKFRCHLSNQHLRLAFGHQAGLLPKHVPGRLRSRTDRCGDQIKSDGPIRRGCRGWDA